ncbi:MAG: ATP-binding protein [Anaeromyxobacter sp.]
MRSLRGALVATLGVAVVAVTLAGGYATYRQARAGIDEVFDYHLRQLALALRDRAAGRGEGDLGGVGEDFDFVVQVWDGAGNLRYLSRPGTGLPPVAQLGFATVAAPGGGWRVFSAALGPLVVQVAQPLAVRERLAVRAALRSLTPLLVLVPLLALLVGWVVSRGLAPLSRIARAVEARTPDSLAPLPAVGVPEEVAPLVTALNELLARLGAALDAQRAFVADAAHELRTPLAALRVQLQLAERAPDPAARAAALAALGAGLDRAARLVQQLLALARAEPASPARPAAPVALGELAARVVADLAALAAARGIDLGAGAVDEGVVVAGDPAALQVLTANLVDNAIRYTPAGGRVDVSVLREGGQPVLEVADTGPGIPPPERARVFDRFYRVAGNAEPGTGLGLSIVKAVAARHGAEVALADREGGGLRVRVAFPLPTGLAEAARPDRDGPP